jgi:hypothetical protein
MLINVEMVDLKSTFCALSAKTKKDLHLTYIALDVEPVNGRPGSFEIEYRVVGSNRPTRRRFVNEDTRPPPDGE